MAYHVEFFCKSGMSNTDEALDTLVRALAERGTPVEVKGHLGSARVSSFELAASPASHGEPAGSVAVNLAVGEEVVATDIRRVADELGGERVVGSDLHLTAILSSAWDDPVFESMMATLPDLWQAVIYDEASGFVDDV